MSSRPPSPIVLELASSSFTPEFFFHVGEETFGKAVQVVITWLERGDCSKRNSSAFYSMIQSTNSHIRRLLSEKAQHEEELQKAKDLMKARMQSLLIQCKLFIVSLFQNMKSVSELFSSAQAVIKVFVILSQNISVML